MVQVTVTYNVWDMNRAAIPAINEPEVWFRPVSTSLAAGLLTDREVKGTLNSTNGAGSVALESVPGLLFMPIVSWLKNPEDPRNRARGQTEWPAFFPDGGGPISTLFPPRSVGAIIADLAPPPAGTQDVVWIDLTDVTSAGVLVYGPGGN